MPQRETTTRMQNFIMLRNKAAMLCSAQYAGMPEKPQEWSVKHIQLFIENAGEKLQVKISERWVYTYFKKDIPEKLPREDMLDIIARYCEYPSWQAFLEQSVETPIQEGIQKKSKFAYLIFILIGFLVIILIFMFSRMNESTTYFKVCFLDAHTMQAAKHPYTLHEVYNSLSSSVLLADSAGCLSVSSNFDGKQLIVSSPYYLDDTFFLSSNTDKNFVLQPDNLAILLQFFIHNEHNNERDKSSLLQQILHPDLKALAIEESSGIPIALYNKEAFIRKLLLRGRTTGRINIVYLSYKNEQIYEIRYLLPNEF